MKNIKLILFSAFIFIFSSQIKAADIKLAVLKYGTVNWELNVIKEHKLDKKYKLFHEIVCVTDKSEYKQIAEYYGAKVPRLRPKHTATSKSPDIEWVKWILEILDDKFDAFCILRPTSPLRKKRMFIDALKIFQSN